MSAREGVRILSISDADRSRLELTLLDRLPALLDEVRAGLQTGWPDYAEFLIDDPHGVTEAAGIFVHRLVDLAAPSDDPEGPGGEGGRDQTVHLVFERIGRQQMEAGNDLTRLLTAFQLGARVAWRHVSATALELGAPPDSLASLADSVFVFVNQLSFSAARGYLQAQLDDSRVLERNREELSELMLSGRAAPQAVRTAATRAGWTLPDRVALVLVDPGDEAARRIGDRLGSTALPGRRETAYGALVSLPDTPADRQRLRRELRGSRAVVGPAVPPDRLPRTVEGTKIVLELHRSGLVPDDPTFADEHLDTLIVWRDRPLLEALRRQVLAPLDDLAPAVRERLVETLTSWLRHQGDRHAVAEELSIHPQTVRYRMAQLRECLGDALDSPDERARLFLALAWPEVSAD